MALRHLPLLALLLGGCAAPAGMAPPEPAPPLLVPVAEGRSWTDANPSGWDVAVAPTSRRFAIITPDAAGAAALWVTAVGGTYRRVADVPTNTYMTGWSADERTLSFQAFSFTPNLTTEFRQVDVATGRTTRSVLLPDGQGHAVMSPAGDRVAYVAERETSDTELVVVDLATDARSTVATGGVMSLAWSPAGDALAYALVQPDDTDMRVAIWRGGAASPASGPIPLSGLALGWLPDARGVRYVTEADAGLLLGTLGTDGRDDRREVALPDVGRADGFWRFDRLLFAPDGQRLMAQRRFVVMPRTPVEMPVERELETLLVPLAGAPERQPLRNVELLDWLSGGDLLGIVKREARSHFTIVTP